MVLHYEGRIRTILSFSILYNIVKIVLTYLFEVKKICLLLIIEILGQFILVLVILG
jgi:hypothetical protein